MTHGIGRREFMALTSAGLASLALSEAGSQETHPSPGPGAAYSFLAVADTHLAENRPDEQTGADKFRRVLAAIEDLEPQPDFMLILGDVHPAVLEEMLDEVPLPIHAVAGNHENKEQRELLRSMFPGDFQDKDYYSFEHKGDLFIAMCNAAAHDHVGHFESESHTPSVGQIEWLEEQFAKRHQYSRVVVYGHIPPHPELRPDGMCLSQNDGRWLVEQVQETRPTALFFGHRHHRVWFDIDGTPVYGMRSCNWNFADEPIGFGHVVTSPRGLDVRFIPTGEASDA